MSTVGFKSIPKSKVVLQVLEQLWQMEIRDPGIAPEATLLLPGLGLGCGTIHLLGRCAPLDGVG